MGAWSILFLYCLARGWLFAACFASVGQLFGYRHFGVLVGAICIAGAAATLLVKPVVALSADQSGIGSFQAIDIFFVVVCIIWTLTFTAPDHFRFLRRLCSRDRVRREELVTELEEDMEDEADAVRTKVIIRKVRPGCGEAYKKCLEKLNRATVYHPGFLGSTVVEPLSQKDLTYITVIRFSGRGNMEAWNNGDVLKHFLQQVEVLTLWQSRKELRERPGSVVTVSLPAVHVSGWDGNPMKQFLGFLIVWLLNFLLSQGLGAVTDRVWLAGDAASWEAWGRQAALQLTSLALTFSFLRIVFGPQVLPKIKED